ncbi:unnamed protein product [Protopolystoma xenopodis]|uniref:Peptidase C19 ubiquitin carboxyl-terminal hydrolase domain-containing protein n=1 Tax=Protopolystoma xenopodis TaxID=117903 RepID=A0A448XR21_9PLAT|nr:unnamed protein product [Protopolystoma xenopodis]
MMTSTAALSANVLYHLSPQKSSLSRSDNVSHLANNQKPLSPVSSVYPNAVPASKKTVMTSVTLNGKFSTLSNPKSVCDPSSQINSVNLNDAILHSLKSSDGESKADESKLLAPSSSAHERLLCTEAELASWCQMGIQCIPTRALGFSNSGNTCYINSVLQCLMATGPLLAYLSDRHSNSSNCNIFTGRTTIPGMHLSTGSGVINNSKPRFCALCGIYRLLREHKSLNNASNTNAFYGSGVAAGQTVPSYFVSNVRGNFACLFINCIVQILNLRAAILF